MTEQETHNLHRIPVGISVPGAVAILIFKCMELGGTHQDAVKDVRGFQKALGSVQCRACDHEEAFPFPSTSDATDLARHARQIGSYSEFRDLVRERYRAYCYGCPICGHESGAFPENTLDMTEGKQA